MRRVTFRYTLVVEQEEFAAYAREKRKFQATLKDDDGRAIAHSSGYATLTKAVAACLRTAAKRIED
jgi:uncharacterized protein YegP (UPF0339 family)